MHRALSIRTRLAQNKGRFRRTAIRDRDQIALIRSIYFYYLFPRRVKYSFKSVCSKQAHPRSDFCLLIIRQLLWIQFLDRRICSSQVFLRPDDFRPRRIRCFCQAIQWRIFLDHAREIFRMISEYTVHSGTENASQSRWQVDCPVMNFVHVARRRIPLSEDLS